jgi:cytochrome b6-f complex iron-sulfur subunit
MALAEPGRDLFGRRDFLTRGGIYALFAALTGGLILSLRTLWPRSRRASLQAVSAGRAVDYSVGEVSERLLQSHQVWIVRDAAGFYAFSAQCTHLGCQLRYAAHARQYRCMCHGSVFDKTGQVLRGPASRPMERVYLTLRGDGELVVDPSLRYRQERGEWSHPGAFAHLPQAKR